MSRGIQLLGVALLSASMMGCGAGSAEVKADPNATMKKDVEKGAKGMADSFSKMPPEMQEKMKAQGMDPEKMRKQMEEKAKQQ